MVINNVILEQIITEQIKILNDFWVYAILMFDDKDMLIKKSVKSMNALTAGKVVAESLDAMVHKYPVGHVDYLIMNIISYVEGVENEA